MHYAIRDFAHDGKKSAVGIPSNSELILKHVTASNEIRSVFKKPNISKRSISLSIFLVIILFLVTGVHAEEEKCVDVSGTWAGTEEIDNSDCGFPNQTISYTYELIQNDLPSHLGKGKRKPGFVSRANANFFTYQDHLVAVERNRLLEREESPWNIILAPGRIWSEPGDNGYSRASFPFTLIHTQSLYSQTHNGIATFLFNDKHVSALRFQIVQEAAPREKFDAWGQADMKYLPSPLPDRIALTQQFVNELAHQTPIHSWTELEQIYDPNALDIIDDTRNRENITLSGLIIDNGETYYHMSLWLQPFVAKSGCRLRIPAMSGGGGTYVISMPNGITAFRFADGRYNDPGTWDSSGLRKVADYIRPFCKKSSK